LKLPYELAFLYLASLTRNLIAQLAAPNPGSLMHKPTLPTLSRAHMASRLFHFLLGFPIARIQHVTFFTVSSTAAAYFSRARFCPL